MDWQTAGAAAGTLAVLGAGLMWFFKVFLPIIRKWSRRWDKIFGVPADPDTNEPAVLGVLERLDAQDAVLQKVLAEVQDNHGGSLKDAVKRVEAKIDNHLQQPQTQININPTEPPT
jgi:hypothetical protein